MKREKSDSISPRLKDLNYIVAHLPGHVYWLDKNHRLMGCNRQQAVTLGFSSPDEIIGKTTQDLFSKKEAEMIDRHNQEVMDTREEKSFEEKIVVGGKKKVFFTQKLPLFDAKKKVIGVMGIGADITQAKNRESMDLNHLVKMAQEVTGVEVKENESPVSYAEMMRDFLEAIIAEMPGNVYWMNRECVFLGCNKNQARIFNLNTPREVVGKTDLDRETVGKTDLDFSWKDQAKALIQNDLEVMQGGIAKEFEEIAKLSNGNKLYYLSNKVPLKDKQGNVIGLLGISLDITERKKLEEQLKQANKAKLSLLSIADIKLRNLLNSSFNALDLLKRERLSPAQKDHLEIVEEANRAMLPLMDYLLDYVNLETNTLDICNMPYDLKLSCQAIIKQKSLKAFKNGIDDIILEYQETAPILIECDGRRLEKILSTLLDNAIRFSDSGVITVRVEDIKREEGSAEIKISVMDQGRGIGQAEQAHLFNLFEQLPIKKKSDYVKAGIKLSIAKKIISMMEAKIGVESTKGKGATFWITLNTPILQQPLNRSNSLPWWDQYRKSVRVLLVDDNVERRTLLHQTLASNKNAVVSGKEAVKKMVSAVQSKQPFDLVVMDGNLSTIDTKQLVQEIKENQTGGILPRKGLVVVMLHPGEEAAILGKLAHDEQQIKCLYKPTIPVEFAETLKELWGQFRTHAPYILLVEDEKLCQRAEKAMLTQLGCRVDIAETGEAGVAFVKQHNYDAIMIDIGLPGQSGLEMMTAVREMKGKDTPPMIVITAHNTEDDSDAFGEAGAFEVLFKPVSLDALQRALHEAVTIYEDEMND